MCIWTTIGSFALRLTREQPIEYDCNIKCIFERLGAGQILPMQVKAQKQGQTLLQSLTRCSLKEFEILT